MKEIFKKYVTGVILAVVGVSLFMYHTTWKYDYIGRARTFQSEVLRFGIDRSKNIPEFLVNTYQRYGGKRVKVAGVVNAIRKSSTDNWDLILEINENEEAGICTSVNLISREQLDSVFINGDIEVDGIVEDVLHKQLDSGKEFIIIFLRDGNVVKRD